MIARVALAFAMLISFGAAAEPWMGSRFANNCAACHAPGKVNVVPRDRRCTFTCKGCHTSPSGGGLRNYNGKWFESRWLNSAYADGWAFNKMRPLPANEQAYSDDRVKSLDPDKKKKAVLRGFKLREAPGFPPEELYSRANSDNGHVETDKQMVYSRIPDADPWRMAQRKLWNAGTDTRLSYFSNSNNYAAKRSGYLFLTDVEASGEPLKHLSAVVGGRFLAGPGRLAWDGGSKKSDAQLKSAYLLTDDYDYNSFAQAGVYRPMFGTGTVDRDSLVQAAMDLDQRANFTTITLGSQPGIPFFNLHYVQPTSRNSYGQDRGFVFNVGAHFPTHGANVMLSYWNTNADDPVTDHRIKRQMMALTGGATFGRLTASLEFTRMSKEASGVRKDTGAAIVAEAHLRIWRETYLKAVYENLNTAADLTDGKSSALGVGLDLFTLSSLHFDVGYRTVVSQLTPAAGSIPATASQLKFDDKTAVAQVHFFF